MPHITKYEEKMQCIRKPVDALWTEDLKRKYLPVSDDDRQYFPIPPAIKKAADATVRALAIPPFMYDRLKDLPQQYSYMTPQDKCTIFDLIEEVIENTMKSNWTDGNFFNEFVDIKEVPYGRYNSDSDYRGS